MTVLFSDPAPPPPPDDDSVNRSDLMNPLEPLCVTLDHPFDCCSCTSTLVPADRVFTTLLLVEGPDLRFTLPVVRSVVEAASAPDSDSRSVRMYPSVPLCLTFDHPFD